MESIGTKIDILGYDVSFPYTPY